MNETNYKILDELEKVDRKLSNIEEMNRKVFNIEKMDRKVYNIWIITVIGLIILVCFLLIMRW